MFSLEKNVIHTAAKNTLERNTYGMRCNFACMRSHSASHNNGWANEEDDEGDDEDELEDQGLTHN